VIKAFEVFDTMRTANAGRLKEAREQGKKFVGTYCTFCPEELIIAAGAAPFGLCGTKEDPIASAEQVLPRNLCPLIKSSYGFAATGTCPYFQASDLIIGETTCDGKKKMFEVMNDLKPVHVMQLPHDPEAAASLDLWKSELNRLKDRLEEVFQTEITEDKLRAAMRLKNRETTAKRRVHDLNQRVPAVISGIQVLTVTWMSGFALNKEEIIEALEAYVDEALVKADEGLAFGDQNTPRILVTGVPVGLGSEKVLRLVEDNGGAVVGLENCTGYKTLRLMTDPDAADPMEALARKYLGIPCSCMSPNKGRMELLSDMITDFTVDGVIDLTWQACHTYNIESYTVAELVKQKHNLPFLQLETDYSQSDVQTLNVRIAAFMEMIQK
jgi:benzoyl-CoA reductase/2-hydroxyglutaryl-CoA dehydratase subunit BcrC/BadD/HgdB